MPAENHANIELALESMATGDWDARAEILAQGYPIAYREKDTPEGCVLMEYPNGKIELIEVDVLGDNDKIVKIIRDGK
jgi:hypothetical protein